MKYQIWEFFYLEKQFYCLNITSFKCCPLLSKQFTVLFITFSGLFPTKDMQTPPLSFGPVFMDDEVCAE